jgi:ferritin-like protein
MNDMTENAYMNEKLQDAVKKLISEEWYAYQLYMFSAMTAKKDQVKFIDDLFKETANDELGDHMKELIEWCRTYDYEIPCGEAEFKKYADKTLSKQLADLKKNKDAGYYLDEAIKSEEAAVKSYKAVLEYPDTYHYTDLQALLWHIYYDEVEHLEKLHTAKIAYEADADLVMI